MNESATPPVEPERWLAVPGYERRYEVSNHHGRVRIAELAARGYVEVVPGKGIFVTRPEERRPRR